jgi:hypothetical protein
MCCAGTEERVLFYAQDSLLPQALPFRCMGRAVSLLSRSSERLMLPFDTRAQGK